MFNENPQIPFSELKIHVFGGSRGDLATPEACGTYTTTADLKPWSAPESGPDATPSDSFAITRAARSGFAPAFSAGTVQPRREPSSPFTLSFAPRGQRTGPRRPDGHPPDRPAGQDRRGRQCSEAQVAGQRPQPPAEAASSSCPPLKPRHGDDRRAAPTRYVVLAARPT